MCVCVRIYVYIYVCAYMYIYVYFPLNDRKLHEEINNGVATQQIPDSNIGKYRESNCKLTFFVPDFS